jgi:flagellar biosynthesis/type III secretory pathway ATPase
MPKVVKDEHMMYADFIRKYMAIYSENEDLIKLGAYSVGSSPDVDLSIKLNEKINEFLQQRIEDQWTFDETVESIKDIYKSLVMPEEEEEFF